MNRFTALMFLTFTAFTAAFKVFVNDKRNGTRITFWHDFMSDRKLCDLWKIGWLNEKNAYAVINFSQYFSRDHHARVIKPFYCFENNSTILSHVLLLANSPEELGILRDFCPSCSHLLFPNNAFIDHSLFPLRDSDIPDVINRTDPVCVVNAKGHKWKRHDLSTPIPNRVFITYDRKKDAPLEAFLPLAIHENVHPTPRLVSLLHHADFGAAFTPSEGNCYASNEYLLTGLPVLSVRSKGGRDVFYEEGVNAVICEASLSGVTEGYKRMQSLLLGPRLNRARIRERVIQKIDGFRDSLSSVVYDWLLRSGSIQDEERHLLSVRASLFSAHKADNYINFYVGRVSSSRIKAAIFVV